MAVAETQSTLGGFKVFSSENITLATTFSEVLNELETHNVPMNQIQFVLSFNDTNDKYAFCAVCKRS